MIRDMIAVVLCVVSALTVIAGLIGAGWWGLLALIGMLLGVAGLALAARRAPIVENEALDEPS